jgi:type I restriction enzyme S subunit
MALGELPAGWSKATVGEVATLFRGVTYSKDQASNSPQIGMKPILRGNNINGELNFDDLVYVPEALIAPEQLISTGDIIFAMSSGSKHLVGKSAKARISFDGGFGAFCGLLRATEAINKDFLHYVFQGSDFRRAISEVSKGSNINNLKREHILDFEFSCPPLAEQHRIVAKIEELFSELDQGVASLKTAREQLKVYRQSLLKNAFEGKLTVAWRAAHRDQLETAAALQQRITRERQARYQQQLADWQTAGQAGPKPKPPKPLPPLTAEELAELPELPEGWFGGRLGWMTCGVEYGTAAKSAEQGTCPVLRMGNIQNGKFDWGSLVFTDDREEIAKYHLSEGDVLFNRTNSPELVGKSAVFKGSRSALFAGYLIRVNQISSIVLPGYLNYFLNSPIARQHGNTVKTDGVNQSNINGEKLINYPFPFCGIEEQNQIVQELEAKLSEADQLDLTLATALQQADALRQSILKKAFHGQLVKQAKNEEPATALLERIRAARANSPAKGRQVKMVSKPLPNC